MAKVLTELEPRSIVFVDSSIFTYFLLEDTRYFDWAKTFLERINQGEIIGAINNIVFTETMFNFVKAKVMIEENIFPREFIKAAKRQPEIIARVDISPVLELFNLPNLSILDLSPESLEDIGKIHSLYGLLSNDAYHLLTMEKHGIKNIATTDRDFERIECLNIWKPYVIR